MMRQIYIAYSKSLFYLLHNNTKKNNPGVGMSEWKDNHLMF